MQKNNLIKRDLYLKKMIAFQDTEMIKVMTNPALRKIQLDEADGGTSAGERSGRRPDH